MGAPQKSSIGSYIKAVAVYGDRMTAAGTGDNTERTSDAINVQGCGSGVLVVSGRTTCAASQTLKLTAKVASAPDNGAGAAGSYSADATLVSTQTIVDGAASPQNFAYSIPIDLGPYEKFLRFKLTLDLSAGATDTADWSAVFVKGGAETLPVT